MPEPTIFTDGNKYANYFVRELYLGFNWGDFSYKQYDGLYLHHATLNGTSLAPQIEMAMHSDGNGRKEAGFQTNKIYK